MKTYTSSITASIVLATAALCSQNANAATSPRDSLVHAQGVCQPSVPTNNVRAYTTGIRNVGATNLYMSCGLPGYWFSSPNGDNFVRVSVANVTGTPKTVFCTLSTGWASSTTAGVTTQGTFTKSALVSAQSTAFIDWNASEELPVDTFFSNSSITCTLPSYTELKWIRRTWVEDVGL